MGFIRRSKFGVGQGSDAYSHFFDRVRYNQIVQVYIITNSSGIYFYIITIIWVYRFVLTFNNVH